MRLAVAGCAIAAALLYVGASPRTWSLVALAGIVGIVATRTWGRVAVGIALVLAGAAAAVTTRVLAVGGGAILCATGVLVALRGPRWSALGARYDAPSERPVTDTDLWDALDRGDDPTA